MTFEPNSCFTCQEYTFTSLLYSFRSLIHVIVFIVFFCCLLLSHAYSHIQWSISTLTSPRKGIFTKMFHYVRLFGIAFPFCILYTSRFPPPTFFVLSSSLHTLSNGINLQTKRECVNDTDQWNFLFAWFDSKWSLLTFNISITQQNACDELFYIGFFGNFILFWRVFDGYRWIVFVTFNALMNGACFLYMLVQQYHP